MQRPPAPIPQIAPGAPEKLAIIDLQAIRSNVRRIRQLIGQRTLIAVVKANAYGHGALQVSRAAVEAGADMLGLAHVCEALELRQAGITASMLAWAHTINTDFEAALAQDIQLGCSGWDLEAIAGAAQASGRTAAIHLKIDTGLGRNGSTAQEWPALVQRAANYQEQGLVKVVGIFSHLAVADQPERQETDQQLDQFAKAVGMARELGLNPQHIHIANTPAALTAAAKKDPAALLGNGVRVGLRLYGLSPLADVTPPGGRRYRPLLLGPAPGS